jgi:low temperature requirement protein LtrA
MLDRLVVPMRGRDEDESHRAATPLELLFDLVIVVAVAVAAGALHHGIAEDHVAGSVLSYVMTFFAIWWAWMSFTWFATAYDTDDVPYRLAVFVQMAGAVIMAAGIARAFDQADWTVVTFGYVVMRLGTVAQWLRAARSDPSHRPNSIRWVIGIAVVQVGWVLLLFVPAELRLAGFWALALAELAIPIWAARAARLRWNAAHIAERYGLFTIIVLGESVLAGTIAISTAFDAGELKGDLVGVVVGALLVVFAMWWLYFERPTADLLTNLTRSFEWGYGHYFIWGAAAAVGAGFAVAVDVATHHAEVDEVLAGYALAVPVAVFVIGAWVLHDLPRSMPAWRMALSPIATVLVLLAPLSAAPALLTGMIVTGLLAARIISTPTRDAALETE